MLSKGGNGLVGVIFLWNLGVMVCRCYWVWLWLKSRSFKLFGLWFGVMEVLVDGDILVVWSVVEGFSEFLIG